MGLVEVFDNLEKIRSVLRSIKVGREGVASKSGLEENSMFKLCIYWV